MGGPTTSERSPTLPSLPSPPPTPCPATPPTPTPTLATPTPTTARGRLRLTPPWFTPPELSATPTLSEPMPSPTPEPPTPSPTLPSASPTLPTLASAPTLRVPRCLAAGRGKLMPTPPSSTLLVPCRTPMSPPLRRRPRHQPRPRCCLHWCRTHSLFQRWHLHQLCRCRCSLLTV